MQIVVKAVKNSDKDPVEVITRNVAETLGDRDEKPVVSKVFRIRRRGIGAGSTRSTFRMISQIMT